MRPFFITLFFCYLASCNNNNRTVNLKQNINDSTDKIASYTSDDRKMNAAIGEARQTFPGFLKQLKSNCEDCERFSVKMRFEFGKDNGEHIWINGLHFKNDKLFGIIANEPENSINVKYGDTVQVEIGQLSDWMYIQNGQLIGGYTIKLIYEESNDAEKKQMEDEFGAKIK